MFQKTLQLVPEPGPKQPFYSMFRRGANANLGRIYEMKKDPARAIFYYTKDDPTQQYVGNLLRAPNSSGVIPSESPRLHPESCLFRYTGCLATRRLERPRGVTTVRYAMHFRSPLVDRRSWDGVHGQWPAMIVLGLNPELPKRYVAEPQIHLGSSFEIDVASFESDDDAARRSQ